MVEYWLMTVYLEQQGFELFGSIICIDLYRSFDISAIPFYTSANSTVLLDMLLVES